MEFSDMLARGLGRAVLYLQTHDPAPHRDAILHACTHFVGYDIQWEPSRSRYCFDLITAGGDRNWYLPHLYHAFATGEDVEMPNQLFGLMGLLAQDGDGLARTMMYDILAEDAPDFDTTGADALVDLDGLDGYVFVARQWSRYPLPEDDQWEEDALLDTVEERFSADAVTNAVAAAASASDGEDADLPTYLSRLRARRSLRDEERRTRSPSPSFDYDAIRGIIDAPRNLKTRSLLWRAGRRADEALLQRLAQDLEAETDQDRVLKLLYCFRSHPYPLPPHRLLALAQNDDADMARAAQDALSHVTHPDVRTLALARIAARQMWHSVDMLAANPAEEDYAFLAELARQTWPSDEAHDLGIGIRNYVEAYPSPHAVPALLGLYENGPCSFCRRSVVEALSSLDAMSEVLLREIVWDAAEDTRMLAVPFRFPDGDEPAPAG